MATLPYNNLIEDLRAYTKDPTYHLHKMGEEYTLRHDTSTGSVPISDAYEIKDMGVWLSAFLQGIHAGYLTAKRGK